MREILWVKPARKEFETFPAGAREIIGTALVIAAEGRKADIAKSMKGSGSGVMEIALPYRADAYRVVYAVQIWDAVKGIATPQKEVELIKARLKRIKEMMP